MSSVLKGLCRFLIKFCWIVIIVAILGGVVGFLTKTEQTVVVTDEYTTSVKFIVDMDHLENNVKFDESSGIADSQVVFTGYNTAYSLFPTFKDVIFSKTTVMEKIQQEYFDLTAEKIEMEDLINAYTTDFPTNSLSFSVSCKSDTVEKSETLIKLMCKYGLERINTVSNIVKVEISSIVTYADTVIVTGSTEQLNAYKKKVEEAKSVIYTSAVESMDDYVQRNSVMNGFDFVVENGKLKLVFGSTNKSLNDFVVNYITDVDFVSDVVTISRENTQILYEEDFYSEKISEEEIIPATDNTMIFAVFGALGAILVLCVIYMYKNGNFTNTEEGAENINK